MRAAPLFFSCGVRRGGQRATSGRRPKESHLMTRRWTAFATDDSGAITVDWVVLTAATLALGLGVLAIISSGQRNAASGLAEDLATPAVRGVPSADGSDPDGATPKTP